MISQPHSTLDHSASKLNPIEETFPNISRMPVPSHLLNHHLLPKLTLMLRYSVPLNAYDQSLYDYYEKINDFYWDCQINGLKELPIEQDSTVLPPKETQKPVKQRKKMNYQSIAQFVKSASADILPHVSQSLLREVQSVSNWAKRIEEVRLTTPKQQQKNDFDENRNVKKAKQKQILKEKGKADYVCITMGKHISPEATRMKCQIIERALRNKIHDISYSDENQINYILNRLTQAHFDHFLQEMAPFATHPIHSRVVIDKIISKSLEQHNFIQIYSKLVRCFKNIRTNDEENKKFGRSFVEEMQLTFIQMIHNRDYSGQEEAHKKQIIGLGLLIGELMKQKVLSLKIYPFCFYTLVAAYVDQYRLHESDKSIFHFEVYIECAVKILEGMQHRYDRLKITNQGIDEIVDKILEGETIFEAQINYIGVLKQINRRLPSQRYKIQFLLEDFRHSQHQKLISEVSSPAADNAELILAIDISSEAEVKRAENVFKSTDDKKQLWKSLLLKFGDTTIKRVNERMQILKRLVEIDQDALNFIESFRQNFETLYLIECDLPYLKQGLAMLIKFVIDSKQIKFDQFKLQFEDEELNEMMEDIELKLYRLDPED